MKKCYLIIKNIFKDHKDVPNLKQPEIYVGVGITFWKSKVRTLTYENKYRNIVKAS